MKTIILLACAFILSGCDELREEDQKPREIKVKMPAGLKDCKTYRVATEFNSFILITRCPNSATTTDYAKSRTTLIDETEEEPEQ